MFTGETKRTLVSDRLGGEAAGPLAGAPPPPGPLPPEMVPVADPRELGEQ